MSDTAVEIDCLNCNSTGVEDVMADGTPFNCPVCRGDGVITVPQIINTNIKCSCCKNEIHRPIGNLSPEVWNNCPVCKVCFVALTNQQRAELSIKTKRGL